MISLVFMSYFALTSCLFQYNYLNIPKSWYIYLISEIKILSLVFWKTNISKSSEFMFKTRKKKSANRVRKIHLFSLWIIYLFYLKFFFFFFFNSLPLFHCWSRCRQECLLSDRGVLLLNVIMNIAVIIYSHHLSCWRHRGLHLFVKGMHPRST